MLQSILHQSVRNTLTGVCAEVEIVACDAGQADTALFCEQLGYDLADSANCILLSSRKPKGVYVACVVLATHRLDVNGKVRSLQGMKFSFAKAEQTVELTGQEIGGVTPLGLPDSVPVLVDAAVMEREKIIIGGGNRTSKIICSPSLLTQLKTVEVHQLLGLPRDEN
jgi:prolyl-tRNA editing enzyme YbaK/EbsC (Cys-tRNA(Pro) deacylase)